MGIANCPDGGHCQNDYVIEVLLAALESVGWVDGPETAPGMGGMMEQVCPWCDKVGTSDDGWAHNPGCIRQAAIAAAKGTKGREGEGLGDQHDDGQLISAVPGLLAASQAALSYLSDQDARDDMSDAGFIRYDDVVDALRAAIAAARPGEGPGEC